MPSKFKNRSSSGSKEINFKAKLDNKIIVAKESGDLVFDLSECNLKTIPNNIFSLCRVFSKESLYLQNNLLTSLSGGGSLLDLRNLKTLDISVNNFSLLPENIHILENLEVLDASRNELQKLPDSIGYLRNLEWLNVSQNKLQLLPHSIGNCKNLKTLNITYNKVLKLPSSLGRIKGLKQLEMDPTVVYPPREVCKKGVQFILEYLTQGEEQSEDVAPSTSEKISRTNEDFFENLQEQVKLREKIKLEKQKQLMDVERQLLQQNEKEVQVQADLKNKKKQLLADIKLQQQKVDNELNKIQLKKDSDHALLLRMLQDEERKINYTINKMLESNKNARAGALEAWEKEKNLDDLLFSKNMKNKLSEKRDILVSMDKIMKEELERVRDYNSGFRICTVNSLALEISKQNDALQNLLKYSGEKQSRVLENFRREEDLQKSAVAALLEKTDGASWRLAKEITMIEAELSELTRIELTKRKLQTDLKIEELNKNRIGLTMLLQELFEKQMRRRKQLTDKIRKMEMIRATAKNSEFYWMEQYDKLLKSDSHNLVQFLDLVNPKLAHEMFVHGVFQYMLLLKDWITSDKKLKELDDKKLSKLGIKNSEDRKKVLNAIWYYLEADFTAVPIPSAPSTEEPSAPPMTPSSLQNCGSVTYLVSDECVICLRIKPNVIFVPCGHLCCCYKCASSVNICPLCRSPIETILEVFKQN